MSARVVFTTLGSLQRPSEYCIGLQKDRVPSKAVKVAPIPSPPPRCSPLPRHCSQPAAATPPSFSRRSTTRAGYRCARVQPPRARCMPHHTGGGGAPWHLWLLTTQGGVRAPQRRRTRRRARRPAKQRVWRRARRGLASRRARDTATTARRRQHARAPTFRVIRLPHPRRAPPCCTPGPALVGRGHAYSSAVELCTCA